MDKDYGLPSLKEKSWDLCLTDPPYSVNVKGDNQKKDYEAQTGKHYNTIQKIDYDDNMSWDIKLKTMEQVFRCSVFTLFTPGYKEFSQWIQYKTPTDILYWYKPNSMGKTSHFSSTNLEPILCYGVIGDLFPFRKNGLRIRLENGFLRHEKYLHSTPKEVLFYKALISNYTKPLKSILDPFLGSGTTAQCCEEMGIPWLGYEIMEAYAPDIEKRIKLGQRAHESYTKLKKKQLFLEDII